MLVESAVALIRRQRVFHGCPRCGPIACVETLCTNAENGRKRPKYSAQSGFCVRFHALVAEFVRNAPQFRETPRSIYVLKRSTSEQMRERRGSAAFATLKCIILNYFQRSSDCFTTRGVYAKTANICSGAKNLSHLRQNTVFGS